MSLQTDQQEDEEHMNPIEYYGGLPLVNDSQPEGLLNIVDKKVAAQGMFIHMNKPDDAKKLKEGIKIKK